MSDEYVPPILWDEFAWTFLFWPTVTLVAIQILLRPLKHFFQKRRWKNSALLCDYVGSNDRAPNKPKFYEALMVLQLGFSVAASFMWVQGTYSQEVTEIDKVIERVLGCLFVIAYIVQMLRHELLPSHALKPFALIDVYTIVPLMLGSDFWLSLLFLRIYRALDAYLEIERSGALHQYLRMSDFTRAIVLIVLKFLCLVTVLGGMILTLEVLGEIPGMQDQFIETSMGSLSFIQMVYWIITTVTTVGYGDFSPTTVPSRIFACAAIIGGVIFFTVETDSIVKLNTLLASGGGTYLPQPDTPHVVILGGGVRNPGPLLFTFLEELFNNDEEQNWPEAVLLCVKAMDPSLTQFLAETNPQIRRRVLYYVGSPMNRVDLERVQVREAAMAFVIADASNPDPDKEDGHNLLRALAVMKLDPNAKIRLMLLRPESKIRAVNAGVQSERCFAVNEIKANMMAHCCRCRGYLTFLSNMVDSGDVAEDQDDAQIQEYCHGMNCAFYGMQLADRYTGLSWPDLVLTLWKEFQVIAVACQLEGRVILNPQKESPPLRGKDVVIVMAERKETFEAARTECDWRIPFREGRAKARMNKASASPLASRSNSLSTMQINLQHLDVDFLASEEGQRSRASLLASKGGHIALLSCSPDRAPWQQIAAFIQPLRSPLRAWEHRPIVVMTCEDPPPALARQYLDVAFVKGAATREMDLEANHVPSALEIVALSGDRPSKDEMHLQDFNCVVVGNTLDAMLKSNNGATFIIYEVQNPSSTEFLPQPEKAARTPTNADVSDALKRGMSTIPVETPKEGDKGAQIEQFDLRMDPRYASGQVFALHFLGQCMGREYYMPSTLELMEALVMPGRKGQPTFPFLVPVPDDLVGGTFGTLFEKWTSSEAECTIPIGLYRSKGKGDLGYVASKCDPSVVLKESDKVYVLASPNWGKRVNGAFLDVTKDGEPKWRKELYDELNVSSLNALSNGSHVNGGHVPSHQTEEAKDVGPAQQADTSATNEQHEAIDRRLSKLECDMQNVSACLMDFDKKLDKIIIKQDEDNGIIRANAVIPQPSSRSRCIPGCKIIGNGES